MISCWIPNRNQQRLLPELACPGLLALPMFAQSDATMVGNFGDFSGAVILLGDSFGPVPIANEPKFDFGKRFFATDDAG